MKGFFGYFLFQCRPPEGASAGRRTAFWLWNALLLAGAAVALGLISLALAPANYGWVIFTDYLARPGLTVLNLLPPLALIALFYGLFGRAWLAYVLTALPVLGLSIGNYYKLVFRDDPVIASDLLLLSEAGKMTENYQLYPAVKVVAALALAVLSAVLLVLFARGRPRLPWRGIAAAAAALAMLAAAPVYTNAQTYSENAALDHLNQWSSTQQYLSHGFLYPFLHSIADALPDPPEGYSERESEELLARYEDADIPESGKVNIVGIMLEAFADFSGYEQIEFQQDVYSIFHQLEAESVHGTLVTDIFAGGTVNTERAFLTGYPRNAHDYRSDTSSYVWYLKSQGYQTSGDHPCFQWFYNRQNINSYLGFDSYRFVENYYGQFTDGSVALDNVFFPELTRSVLEQVEDDAPVFSFSVSYQGHGPYTTDQCWWGDIDDYIANNELDTESRYILANYFGSVLDTQRNLAEMVDAFRASDEPIVLVVFGDHKPWLGNGNSVYNALGIDLSQSTDESVYTYWSTPYLIWANDAAEKAVGHDVVGEGPTISPCFLMNVLFEQLGWTGDAYMQAADAVRRDVPVIQTSGFYLTGAGELTRELNAESAEQVRDLERLAYYRSHHFPY